MRTKISQSEAHRLRRQNAQLQDQLNNARQRYRPYVAGTYLTQVNLSACPEVAATLKTAQTLGFGVRVNIEGTRADFYAIDPRATP